MLELFRKNLFIYNTFLLLYLIVLRISWFFIDAPTLPMTPGVLSKIIYQWVGSESGLIKVIAILLLIYQAIQINRLVSLNRLTSQNSLFPGLLYLLLVSMSLSFLPLYPVLLGNTFVIIMFMDVFRQTRNIELPLKMFNVGFWAGLASLFYWPYIIFLLMGCLGVMHLRTFKPRDFMRALIGCIVPYIILGTTLFLSNNLDELLMTHFRGAFAFFDFQGHLSWKGYVLVGIFAMSSIIALATSKSMGVGLNIHVRKKITVLLLSLVSTIILVFLVKDPNVSSLLFTSVPLSVLLGSLFLDLEKQFAEILHFILFATALLFQYLV